MDAEINAFDVFGTLLDWRSGIAAALVSEAASVSTHRVETPSR
jgi:hypothetical protein